MLTVKASRPYRLSDLSRFRQPFPTPFDRQSQRLRQILTKHHNQKTASVTYGILDPIQLVQSSDYLDTVYVSGWTAAATLTTNNEYGPDYADYCSNTLPFHVERLRKAQEFHSLRLNKDIMHPIIADADCGFGGLTSVMKTVKMLISAGSAGIHLEDQRADGKKCGHLGGKVLVSTRAHIDRLLAARLQADLMGSSLVCISRTDAQSASFIDTDIDPRDQPYIIGKLTSSYLSGEYTLPEALQHIHLKRGLRCPPVNLLTMQEMRKMLRSIAPRARFDLQALRSNEGFYPVRSSTEYAIKRAQSFEPYADMQWIETSAPNLAQAYQIAKNVPGCLSYNLSPSFPWDKYHNDSQLKAFSSDLGKLGFCWQFVTLGGFHVNGLATSRFARAFAKDGMLAYVKMVQNSERDENITTYRHQNWAGVNYVDDLLSLITTTREKSGEHSTEKDF